MQPISKEIFEVVGKDQALSLEVENFCVDNLHENCFKAKDKKMGVLEAFDEDCSEAKYHGEEIVENIVRDLNEPK